MMYDVYWYCQMKKKEWLWTFLKKGGPVVEKRGEEETKSMSHAPVVSSRKLILWHILTKCILNLYFNNPKMILEYIYRVKSLGVFMENLKFLRIIAWVRSGKFILWRNLTKFLTEYLFSDSKYLISNFGEYSGRLSDLAFLAKLPCNHTFLEPEEQ